MGGSRSVLLISSSGESCVAGGTLNDDAADKCHQSARAVVHSPVGGLEGSPIFDPATTGELHQPASADAQNEARVLDSTGVLLSKRQVAPPGLRQRNRSKSRSPSLGPTTTSSLCRSEFSFDPSSSQAAPATLLSPSSASKELENDQSVRSSAYSEGQHSRPLTPRRFPHLSITIPCDEDEAPHQHCHLDEPAGSTELQSHRGSAGYVPSLPAHFTPRNTEVDWLKPVRLQLQQNSYYQRRPRTQTSPVSAPQQEDHQTAPGIPDSLLNTVALVANVIFAQHPFLHYPGVTSSTTSVSRRGPDSPQMVASSSAGASTSRGICDTPDTCRRSESNRTTLAGTPISPGLINTPQRRRRWSRSNRLKEAAVTIVMIRTAMTLADRKSPALQRLLAAIRLENMLQARRNRKEIVRLLIEMGKILEVRTRRRSCTSRLRLEITVIGNALWRWLAPERLGGHRTIFSLVYSLLVLVPFFFMAGAYESSCLSSVEACSTGSATSCEAHPVSLLAWVNIFRTPRAFSTSFLVDWGARYPPAGTEQGQWYRWITSVIIHQSFPHVLSNWLLVACASPHLEWKYGPARVAALWVASCLGGQLLSAALEDNCKAVVGASGGAFGLLGLFVADLAMNFKTIACPVLRGIVLTVVVVFSIIASQGSTVSALSHVGGLISGLFPAVLILPRVSARAASRRRRQLQLIFTAASAIGLVGIFALVPMYLLLLSPSVIQRSCT